MPDARRKPFYARELDEYPTGLRRAWLLFVVILANFIANYEAQISPVLPLILKDLQISGTTYGLIATVTVVTGALGAIIFGPLSDRIGRVRVMVPLLFITAFAAYLMTLVDSATSLLLVRGFLTFVDGAMIGASAGLVRDFSPRLSRAVGFAFWTFGPVGSNFFANALAGWTLPIFGTWQSQFYINGTLSLLASILIMFTIHDLSPRLRARILHTAADAAEPGPEPAGESRDSEAVSLPREVEVGSIRELARHAHVWCLIIGISIFLTMYFTMQMFGTLFLVQAFGFEEAEAASIAKYFWLVSLVVLLLAGWVSDRLQLRKIVSLVGALLTVALLIYWIPLVGTELPRSTMILHASLIGSAIAIAFAPWMALFSENVEDIKATLQASGWALWNFTIRLWVMVVAFSAPAIAEHRGWQTWLWVCLAGGVLYIPLLAAGKGPWFRRARPALHEQVRLDL